MSNPCLSCGVCCKSYRVAFHWSEITPLGSVPAEMTVPIRIHEVAMKGTEHGGSCVALQSMVIDNQLAVGCGIHGRHPSVCRDVAVGSDQCQRARTQHGLELLTKCDIDKAYVGDHPPAY